MNLIDTNAVTYIFESGIQTEEIYYMAPEVIEETEMTEAIFDKKLSQNIVNISRYDFFEETSYIDFYKRMLNKHHGKSFFNMTGFGDISILATIHTIFKVLIEQKQKRLFDLPESISIFTNDGGLKKRVDLEFSNLSVYCKPYEDIR